MRDIIKSVAIPGSRAVGSDYQLVVLADCTTTPDSSAQPSLFDLQEGRRRRDAGRSKAASAHGEWLTEVRKVAAWRARIFGTVTTDDIRAMGYETPEGANPRAIWGSVFVDSRFESVGYIKSKRPEAHARPIQIWSLK